MRHRAKPTPTPVVAKQTPRGVDFGWRTHAAIGDWTAKVDTKAAIILALGSGLLGFLVTLSGGGRVLAGLHGWPAFFERLGLGASSLGVLLTATVVLPRLNRRKSKKNWQQNFIYFGHLRHWDPADLKVRLLDLDADRELTVLSEQLVNTSKIAWTKHSRLQKAMFLLIVGVMSVALSAVWPR